VSLINDILVSRFAVPDNQFNTDESNRRRHIDSRLVLRLKNTQKIIVAARLDVNIEIAGTLVLPNRSLF
jgi:hypothetical protein